VYQLGLRNPVSVTFAPDGRLFIADTGWFSWEEIDSGGPGANFGWPFFEGNDSGVSAPTPDYSAMPAAQVFYSSVANGTTFVTAPIRAFSHNSADPGFQNQAITAGEAIYTGNVYPASLQNNFFFTSFPTGQIFTVNINNRADAKFLYSVAGAAPTDFVQGPDGSVYYADLVNGVIGRLDITDASAPVNAPVTLAIGSGPGYAGAEDQPGRVPGQRGIHRQRRRRGDRRDADRDGAARLRPGRYDHRSRQLCPWSARAGGELPE
jgi:hypothetical protein